MIYITKEDCSTVACSTVALLPQAATSSCRRQLLATPAAQRQARRAAARSYETKSSGARFWLV